MTASDRGTRVGEAEAPGSVLVVRRYRSADEIRCGEDNSHEQHQNAEKQNHLVED
jgi:hypothetical protein